MSKYMLILLSALLVVLPNTDAAERNDGTKQQLMAKCKAAVNEKMAPARQKRIDECVEKKHKKDRAACEHYYRDYAHKEIAQLELYRDVPECVEAENYIKSQK